MNKRYRNEHRHWIFNWSKSWTWYSTDSSSTLHPRCVKFNNLSTFSGGTRCRELPGLSLKLLSVCKYLWMSVGRFRCDISHSKCLADLWHFSEITKVISGRLMKKFSEHLDYKGALGHWEKTTFDLLHLNRLESYSVSIFQTNYSTINKNNTTRVKNSYYLSL